MVEFTNEDLRGSNFRNVHLSDSRLHSVALRNVKITDAWLDHVEIAGEIGGLIVNGIDVTAFVDAELDKRYPDRRQMLAATDADGLRAAWAAIEEQAAVARARALPVTALDESVDGEFSFLQTLRHLVFATDRWITGPVFADPQQFHPIGYPHEGAEEWEGCGFDADLRPSLDEVLAVRGQRIASVAELLRTSSDTDLTRAVSDPNGGGTVTVLQCVHVVINEEWWHNRYATRDLDILATRENQ
jgi:hypothetical protein